MLQIISKCKLTEFFLIILNYLLFVYLFIQVLFKIEGWYIQFNKTAFQVRPLERHNKCAIYKSIRNIYKI